MNLPVTLLIQRPLGLNLLLHLRFFHGLLPASALFSSVCWLTGRRAGLPGVAVRGHQSMTASG
jgi:hypothetical protein